MVKYTIGDALKKGIALLNENKIETATLDARIIMCHVIECDTLHLTLHREDQMTDDAADKFFELIGRRAESEPVSYITEKKEFMSMDYFVDSNVLIPRPDTEILVERALKELNGINKPVVVDMCTGSGAIALSLGKYLTDSRILALDISEGALDVARKNAAANGVDAEFAIHDVLTPYTGCMADAVVSNPPYIPTADIKTLEKDVADFEPLLALDGGEDGLVFYRAIVQNISSCLKKGGLLAFEVGMGQADDVKKLMESQFEKISIDCDLAGIERVVYGYLKK